MVHALREIWRVLKNKGILIDLRPLHDNIILETVRGDETTLLTRYERESQLVSDKVAENAIATVCDENRFEFIDSAGFDYVKFYDTGEELLEYNAARNPPIEHPDEIIQQIKLADTDPNLTLCLETPMHLKTYRRVDMTAIS